MHLQPSFLGLTLKSSHQNTQNATTVITTSENNMTADKYTRNRQLWLL
jgi:hypothetical protein